MSSPASCEEERVQVHEGESCAIARELSAQGADIARRPRAELHDALHDLAHAGLVKLTTGKTRDCGAVGPSRSLRLR